MLEPTEGLSSPHGDIVRASVARARTQGPGSALELYGQAPPALLGRRFYPGRPRERVGVAAAGITAPGNS